MGEGDGINFFSNLCRLFGFGFVAGDQINHGGDDQGQQQNLGESGAQAAAAEAEVVEHLVDETDAGRIRTRPDRRNLRAAVRPVAEWAERMARGRRFAHKRR